MISDVGTRTQVQQQSESQRQFLFDKHWCVRKTLPSRGHLTRQTPTGRTDQIDHGLDHLDLNLPL